MSLGLILVIILIIFLLGGFSGRFGGYGYGYGHGGVGLIGIILIILVWPVALIYYFTRKRTSLTIQIRPQGDGSQVQINTLGEKADEALGMITSGLTGL